MATTHPLPPPPVAPPRPHEAGRAPELDAEQALVPLPRPVAEAAAIKLTPPLARLPVELDVAVPVREFRVRNLLTLEPGQLISSLWAHGEDMPLSSGDVQLAWSEFEVVDAQLAVRVTRLV